jgi:membrane protein implicated in regulation of membrane protease activity
MILNAILDHIPLWLYVTVGCLGAAAAFYFLSPILVPLWAVTPKPVKWALVSIVAIIGAVLAGRYKGAKDERDLQARRDADALENRVKVDNEVEKKNAPTVHTDLDRWNRD